MSDNINNLQLPMSPDPELDERTPSGDVDLERYLALHEETVITNLFNAKLTDSLNPKTRKVELDEGESIVHLIELVDNRYLIYRIDDADITHCLTQNHPDLTPVFHDIENEIDFPVTWDKVVISDLETLTRTYVIEELLGGQNEF